MKKDLVRIALVLGFICISAVFSFAQTYPNPSQQETNEWRSKGTCSDPWISKAVSQANASVRLAHTSNGSDGECDASQYNKGQWSSYDQLRKAVDKRRDDMSLMKLYYDSMKNSKGDKALFLLETGSNKIVLATLVGNDGASLIGNDSAGIKAIVNRLVAAGGGNLVAAGGMNLRSISLSNLATAISSPGAYSLKAGEQSVLVKIGSQYVRVKK